MNTIDQRIKKEFVLRSGGRFEILGVKGLLVIRNLRSNAHSIGKHCGKHEHPPSKKNKTS